MLMFCCALGKSTARRSSALPGGEGSRLDRKAASRHPTVGHVVTSGRVHATSRDPLLRSWSSPCRDRLLGRWTWRVGVILRPQQIDSSCWCACHGLEPTTCQPMLVHALKVPRSDRDRTGGSSAQAEISFLAGGRCGAGGGQGDEMEVVSGSQREVLGLAF